MADPPPIPPESLAAIVDTERVFDGYLSGDWTNFMREDSTAWWVMDQAKGNIDYATRNRDRRRK
jgi:hypothetical protein